MRGSVFPYLAAASFGLMLGCGRAAAPPPARPPPPAHEPQTRTGPRHEPDRPELVAPPPAYGNKVVLSQAEPPQR
jgi:hypothetical protein